MMLTKAYGHLEPPVAQPVARQATTNVLMNWVPNEQFASEFRLGKSITLKCCYRSNGDRILVGAFGESVFLIDTISLGISIAKAEGHLASGETRDCRLRFLLYQWLNRKRTSFKKRFVTLSDFIIAEPYRENKFDAHVLAHLRDMDGAFDSIERISRLATEGSMIDRVQSGLHVLAARHSLRIQKPSQIDATIKNALFSTDEIELCTDEALLEDVERRLWRAIQPHLNEPTEEFDKWFWGKAANLENRLAQKCEAHHETALSRNEVKAALFEIGWRGHKLLGKMFELGMTEIRAHLPDPSKREDQIHDQLYARQPHLASLPLAMLLNYRQFAMVGFLGHVWTGIVNEQAIDSLHTMLYFYSEMVRIRRAADRRAKRALILELYGDAATDRNFFEDGASITDQIVEALPGEEKSGCVECASSLLDRKFWATTRTIVMSSACQECGTVQPEKKYPTAKIREWMMVDGDQII